MLPTRPCTQEAIVTRPRIRFLITLVLSILAASPAPALSCTLTCLIFSGARSVAGAGRSAGHQEGHSMAEHIDQWDRTGRRTVAGLFPDRASAEQAIEALNTAGFIGDQIGVAMRDRTAQGTLIEDTGTQTAEGAATGVISGGLLG